MASPEGDAGKPEKLVATADVEPSAAAPIEFVALTRAEYYSGGSTSFAATSRRWVEKIQRVPSLSTAR